MKSGPGRANSRPVRSSGEHPFFRHRATVRFTTRDVTATEGKVDVAQCVTLTFAPLELVTSGAILAAPNSDFNGKFVVVAAQGIKVLPPRCRYKVHLSAWTASNACAKAVS